MQITENFREALKDYIFLLEKRYPEKAIHELVSTRYALDHFERSVLYRGVTTKEQAAKRKEKLITIKQFNNVTIHIDLFNVLFTIAAYLRGHPVYLALDGLLRDASESHGKGDWEVHLEKGLETLLEFLAGLAVNKSILYLDDPLEFGPAIAGKLREIAMPGKSKVLLISDASPDRLMREATAGVLATSDSTIIDKSVLPVFDLARAVLSSRFAPKIMALEDEVRCS